MSERKPEDILSGEEILAEFEVAFGPADELEREWRDYIAELIRGSKRSEPRP
jgi:hypothetical protein